MIMRYCSPTTLSISYKTTKSQKDYDSLQEDLDAAARWESDWLMAFHPIARNDGYFAAPELFPEGHQK
jgi:hypothetical protein